MHIGTNVGTNIFFGASFGAVHVVLTGGDQLSGDLVSLALAFNKLHNIVVRVGHILSQPALGLLSVEVVEFGAFLPMLELFRLGHNNIITVTAEVRVGRSEVNVLQTGQARDHLLAFFLQLSQHVGVTNGSLFTLGELTLNSLAHGRLFQLQRGVTMLKHITNDFLSGWWESVEALLEVRVDFKQLGTDAVFAGVVAPLALHGGVQDVTVDAVGTGALQFFW